MCNGVFIVITGYFMLGKPVKYRKIIPLAVAMFFYAWIIALILYGGGFFHFSLGNVIVSLLPMWFGMNWFVSCYMIFLLFIPYINKFLDSIDKHEWERLLIILFAVDILMPSFNGNTFVNESQLVYFFFMYCIGGYCKRYLLEDKQFRDYRVWCKYLLISLMALCLSIGGIDFLGYILHNDIFVKKAWFLVNALGVFVTVFMFLCFLTMPTFHNRIINKIAAATLGIYLIHDNPLIRELIWNRLYPNSDYITSNFFPFMMIVKVLFVYIICMVIGRFRLRYLA